MLERMYDWLDVGACLLAMAIGIVGMAFLAVDLFEP